jgi:hypothetical protein
MSETFRPQIRNPQLQHQNIDEPVQEKIKIKISKGCAKHGVLS